MAAQFSRTMGLWRRGLSSWMASANTSLPEPVSPVSSTVAVVGATCSTCSMRYRTEALSMATCRGSFIALTSRRICTCSGARRARSRRTSSSAERSA